jgi:hypothetical protein
MQVETDSVYWAAEYDSLETVMEEPVKSLFESHSLVANPELKVIEKSENESSFGFIILLICLAIVIYIQRNSDGVFSSVLKAGFDQNLANQDARIENSQRTRNMILLQLVALLSLALYGSSLFVRFYETDFSIPSVFLWAMVIILCVLFLKRILQWVIVQVFDLQSELKIYRFSGNVLLSLAGLMLLPLSILLLFSPQIPLLAIAIGGFGLLGFFYLKTLMRGLQIAMISNSMSPLYLFYYFCALEMLPVFVFIRIARNL